LWREAETILFLIVVGCVSGIEKWTGYQIHSHNYRVPEPFRDQVL